MKPIKIILLFALFTIGACNNQKEQIDAYGNFEAREIIVSAETSGRILSMNIEEGRKYQEGTSCLQIDSKQAELKKNELEAKIMAAKAQKQNVQAQVGVVNEQIKVLEIEKKRVQKLFADGAATSKQLDDITGKIQILEKQKNATQSNILNINAEIKAIDAGIAQVEDIIFRSTVKMPSTGVILAKYVEPGEVTSPGRALFKVANLDVLELKAYISGNQLSSVAIGQKVKVFIDGKDENLIEYDGVLSWISANAEFTPKNIQTKEERLSQVYAIKVQVKNDGALKINMPAELMFN